MERHWKSTNDKSVKNFKLSVMDKSEKFFIIASDRMSVYDFKRLILTEIKKPFFFNQDVSN